MSTTTVVDQFWSSSMTYLQLHAVQETPTDFSTNFASRTALLTGGTEYSLDFIAYSACASPNMALDPVCIELEPYVTQYLADPVTGAPRQLWRDPSKKTIVYLGDEQAQTQHLSLLSLGGSMLEQQAVAQLVQLADIRVHLYVDPAFMDTTTSLGYGAIVLDELGNCNGKMYDLQQAVNTGTLTSTYESDVIDAYCNETPSNDCEGN
jgi:hypothetical protein